MAADDENQRLCAVLIADITGHTKLVELDTEVTVAAWRISRANIIVFYTLDIVKPQWLQ